MDSFSDFAGEILRRRNIDLTLFDDEDPTTSGHNAQEWRVAQAEAALAATTPGRFINATVDHPRVREWVEQFNADPRRAPSLTLAGTLGTGKTHLAFAALRAVVVHAARVGCPLSFRVITHPQMNHMLRPKSDGSHEHALEPFESVDLLLLDDLGAGHQSTWTADCLYRLIDHRWSTPLPSIFTTNFDPDDLAAATDPRVVSRVFDGRAVLLRGGDRRGYTPRGAQ